MAITTLNFEPRISEAALARVPRANTLRISLTLDVTPDAWEAWYLELQPKKGYSFTSAMSLATSIGVVEGSQVIFDLTASQMNQDLQGQPYRRLWCVIYSLNPDTQSVRTWLTGYLVIDEDAASLTAGPPPEPFLPFATRGELAAVFEQLEGKANLADVTELAAVKADRFPFALSAYVLSESVIIPPWHNAVTSGPLHIPAGVDLHVPATANMHIVRGRPAMNNQEELGAPQVLMAFAEAVGDLANSIGYMWLANDDNPQLRLRYRPQGTVTWHDASCWTSTLWGRSERIHRARLTGLLPNTVYELRPWGAPLSDTRLIRTAPAGIYEPKILHLADYQTNNYTPGEAFDAMNAVVGGFVDDVHLIVAGGDYTNDDGVRNATNGTRWWDFLSNIHTHYKRSDGTLVPWVWLAGNHEAVTNYSNVSDPNNPVSDPGYLQELFQMLWDTNLPNVPVRGHGWLKFGSNLLLVFLDTNHTTFLTDQLASFADILEEYAPMVRHVCIVSHVSPWRGQWSGADGWAAHRQLRRSFLPLAQEYPNLKFWLTGHEHNFSVTYPVRAVPESGNEYKWVRDDAKGVVFTGHGGWATVSTRGLANVALESPVDGSLMYESYIFRNDTTLQLLVSNVDNPPAIPAPGANVYPEHYHFFTLQFGLTHATAVARNRFGQHLKTVTRPI